LGAWNGSHAADLRFQLPIAELKLLDGARHLPNLGLEPIDAQHQVGLRRLADTLTPALWWRGRLAATEHAIENVERGAAILSKRSGGRAQSGSQGHCLQSTSHQSEHREIIWFPKVM